MLNESILKAKVATQVMFLVCGLALSSSSRNVDRREGYSVAVESCYAQVLRVPSPHC